jgi:hypothetical protein
MSLNLRKSYNLLQWHKFLHVFLIFKIAFKKNYAMACQAIPMQCRHAQKANRSDVI